MPGRLTPVRESIPQAKRNELVVAAGRLLALLRNSLDRSEAMQMVYALKAAQWNRMAGGHGRQLLTALREALGAKRGAHADELYQLLEVLAVRHTWSRSAAMRPAAVCPVPAAVQAGRADPGSGSCVSTSVRHAGTAEWVLPGSAGVTT